MKKFLSILVIALVGVVLPLRAEAATGTTSDGAKVSVTKVGDCKDKGDGTCDITYKVSITSSTEIEYDQIPIVIKYAPKDNKQNGITSITFSGNDTWEVLPSQTSDGYEVIYTPKSGGKVKATSFDLGTFVVNAKKGEEYDCSFNCGFGDLTIEVEVKTETTVQTGASLPIIILGCGAIAAGVIYFVTKKNTKLYKI